MDAQVGCSWVHDAWRDGIANAGRCGRRRRLRSCRPFKAPRYDPPLEALARAARRFLSPTLTQARRRRCVQTGGTVITIKGYHLKPHLGCGLRFLPHPSIVCCVPHTDLHARASLPTPISPGHVRWVCGPSHSGQMDDRAGVEVLVGGKACASVRRMRSRSLVCTTPPGVGRELRVLVQVRVPPYELWCVCVCVCVCLCASDRVRQRVVKKKYPPPCSDAFVLCWKKEGRCTRSELR